MKYVSISFTRYSLPLLNPYRIFFFLTEQIEEGVGDSIDDLALKREEEKLKKGQKKRNFDHLPANGGGHSL